MAEGSTMAQTLCHKWVGHRPKPELSPFWFGPEADVYFRWKSDIRWLLSRRRTIPIESAYLASVLAIFRRVLRLLGKPALHWPEPWRAKRERPGLQPDDHADTLLAYVVVCEHRIAVWCAASRRRSFLAGFLRSNARFGLSIQSVDASPLLAHGKVLRRSSETNSPKQTCALANAIAGPSASGGSKCLNM